MGVRMGVPRAHISIKPMRESTFRDRPTHGLHTCRHGHFRDVNISLDVSSKLKNEQKQQIG